MKIKDKHKIILFSIAGGLVLWLVDAAVDSFLFSHGSFLDSLLFDQSLHELYFRSLYLAGIVVFGILAQRILTKRRQTEERYKNLVELSNDIIYIDDKDGKRTFMNDAAYRILERTPAEVIGKSCMELLHPEERTKFLNMREELAKQNTDTLHFENRYVTRSGRMIDVLHNVRVLRDSAGTFAGTQGIARDITDRKQAEEALRQARARAEDEKARSESIISAIGDGISIVDIDFKIMYQNHVHKKLCGGDRTGQFCHQLHSRDDGICPGCPVAEAFKDGMVHTLEKTISWNGEVRTLEINASPLMDAAGKIIAGIEAVRDITARRSAEEKLKLFSVAIEEAMDGIQIVDLDGHVVYSNKAVLEIYGFSHEELVGRHINEMNADPEFAKRSIIPRIRDTGRWNGELLVVHKDGRTFPVWLSLSLVKGEHGRPLAMIGIIRDITGRKQAEGILKRHHEQLMKLVEERTRELSTANEKLLKEIADREKMEDELLKAHKLESLGVLAGGIAHDFNNLLAAIMGNISLAMLDLDPENSAYQQLEGAEKASFRAQDLTRQLLTFSKGGAPVTKTTVIGELIREAAGFALRGSRVKHDLQLPEDLRLVDVDEGQLSQVIHNLLINADHAMSEGGIVTIRCENAVVSGTSKLPLRQGDYVKISVRDQGIGISKEHLSKIFDPYFTTKQKGSGLGLATSYSIIRKHGGHILAESEMGKGSTFIIYLPASNASRPTKRTEEMKLFTGVGKVLLMDDEEDVRQTTGDVLKRLGYTVAFAADGGRAIELYQEARKSGTPFDAVIMDLTIPGGMGGKETLKKLLEIDPDIRAIVSSGYSNDPIMADYRKCGFRGVVKKPYRIQDLGETLYTVILDKASGLPREKS